MDGDKQHPQTKKTETPAPLARIICGGLPFIQSLGSMIGMRFLVTITLLFSLVSSQAGLVWFESCFCSTSVEHYAACCCSGEAQTGRSCCEKSDPEDKPASPLPVATEMADSGCQCVEVFRDAPDPLAAELLHETLLEVLPLEVLEVSIVAPALPPRSVAPRYSRTKPPASPRRIQFCSFQL
ncbi:MAG: hypothetical protein ACI8T1_001447 [Verrucomicrobiales bacterium]|jgi:hypothetical protein